MGTRKIGTNHCDDVGDEDEEADDVGASSMLQRTLKLVLVRINLIINADLLPTTL